MKIHNELRAKRVWSVMLLVLVLGSPAAAPGSEADPLAIEWLSYRAARSAGRDLDRPILLQFTTDAWCEPCRTLERETYADRRIIRYVSRHFAASRIDGLRMKALARKYSVETLPTLWLLDPSGRALTHVRYEVEPEKLLRVLEFVKTKSYERTDFETWLKRRRER